MLARVKHLLRILFVASLAVGHPCLAAPGAEDVPDPVTFDRAYRRLAACGVTPELVGRLARAITRDGAAAPGEIERRVRVFVGYLAEHEESLGADAPATIEGALAALGSCQPVVRFKLWELSPSQECYAMYMACTLACAAVPPPWSAACLALCLEELIDCLHKLT